MTDLRTTTDHTDHRPSLDRCDTNATGRDPGSRAARAVWITLGGILAIAALAWGTYSVISVLAHEEHTERSTFSSDDVSALAVSNENGSVTITATPGDTVTVVAKVSDGWQTTDMSMQVVDGVLELNTDCPAFVSPWCNVDFTVSIPADRPVTVDGSGSGAGARDVGTDRHRQRRRAASSSTTSAATSGCRTTTAGSSDAD